MSVTHILHLEALGFLYGLAGVLVYQMLTGRINLAGLLTQKNGTGQTSPERVQLLLATLAAGATYVSDVARNTSGTMPDISNTWLYLMGGSSGIYAVGKAWTAWSGKSN